MTFVEEGRGMGEGRKKIQRGRGEKQVSWGGGRSEEEEKRGGVIFDDGDSLGILKKKS